jgi:hypothetical protein
MQLFGIVLRRPSSGELTVAAVMAVGCWLAIAGLARASGHPLAAADAGALLVVVAWGCIGARCGLRFDRGPRHIAAHLAVGGLLLGLYQGALAIGVA